jgi:hypothetical protein
MNVARAVAPPTAHYHFGARVSRVDGGDAQVNHCVVIHGSSYDKRPVHAEAGVCSANHFEIQNVTIDVLENGREVDTQWHPLRRRHRHSAVNDAEDTADSEIGRIIAIGDVELKYDAFDTIHQNDKVEHTAVNLRQVCFHLVRKGKQE